jgi:hypothetical protein
MDKEITFSNVDIVEQARKIGSEDADDLAVMQYIAQATLASQAVRIRKYFDDRTSQGWVQHFDNIPITDADPAQEFIPDRPAQSISITNDGPGVIWFRVNYRFDTKRTLNIRETQEVNFETHKLERFFVQCPPLSGLTASFRATTKG